MGPGPAVRVVHVSIVHSFAQPFFNKTRLRYETRVSYDGLYDRADDGAHDGEDDGADADRER